MFEIRHEDTGSAARAGRITTPHNAFETPVFMPVGTSASVKMLTPEQVAEAGADIITVHLEANGMKKAPLARAFNRIRKHNIKAGLSINPKTPAHRAYPYLKDVDMVLVMTVEPGFGKQKMIKPAVKKISLLKERILAEGSGCVIEVDGGINEKTIARVVRAGADVLVCGSVIFKQKDIIKAYNKLNNIINSL